MDTSLNAVGWVTGDAKSLREAREIHLINVQVAPPNDIGRFINAETLKEFHLDNGI